MAKFNAPFGFGPIPNTRPGLSSLPLSGVGTTLPGTPPAGVSQGAPGANTSPFGHSPIGETFNGLLSKFLEAFRGKQQAPVQQPTVGLREAPADIQALTSMISQGRNKPNFGGFLGGMFDDKG